MFVFDKNTRIVRFEKEKNQQFKSIFEEVDQITVFQSLLDVNVKLGGAIKSPLREDKNPSASFFVNEKGILVLKDWRLGRFNMVELVMSLRGLSYGDACKWIYETFVKNSKISNLVKINNNAWLQQRANEVFKNPDIQVKVKPSFSEEALTFWDPHRRITTEILHAFGIYECEYVWFENNSGSYPVKVNMTFCYVQDGVVFQVYFPLNKRDGKQMRFRNRKNMRFVTMDYDKTKSYVVITKSRKCSFYLTLHGVNNCFIINEAILLKDEEFEQEFKGKTVFTLFDNDVAGRRTTVKYKRKFNTIPLLVPSNNYKLKDFSDLFNYMSFYRLMETINFIALKFKINDYNKKIF